MFFYFCGSFFPPRSGSGFRIRIRIHWPDWIQIQSGSPTLPKTVRHIIFLIQRCNTSAGTTRERASTSTSTVFWCSRRTPTTWTGCGASWRPRSSCRTGTRPSRTSTGSSSSLTRAPSAPRYRPYSSAPGSYTGHSLSSSTIPRSVFIIFFL